MIFRNKNGFPIKNLGNDTESPCHSCSLLAGIHECIDICIHFAHYVQWV